MSVTGASNRFCDQCGAVLKPESKFCSACGAKVASAGIATTTTSPPIALPPMPDHLLPIGVTLRDVEAEGSKGEQHVSVNFMAEFALPSEASIDCVSFSELVFDGSGQALACNVASVIRREPDDGCEQPGGIWSVPGDSIHADPNGARVVSAVTGYRYETHALGGFVAPARDTPAQRIASASGTGLTLLGGSMAWGPDDDEDHRRELLHLRCAFQNASASTVAHAALTASWRNKAGHAHNEELASFGGVLPGSFVHCHRQFDPGETPVGEIVLELNSAVAVAFGSVQANGLQLRLTEADEGSDSHDEEDESDGDEDDSDDDGDVLVAEWDDEDFVPPITAAWWEKQKGGRLMCRYFYAWTTLGDGKIAGRFGGYEGGGCTEEYFFYARFEGRDLVEFKREGPEEDPVAGDEYDFYSLSDEIQSAADECFDWIKYWNGRNDEGVPTGYMRKSAKEYPIIEWADNGDAYLWPEDPEDRLPLIMAMQPYVPTTARPGWDFEDADLERAIRTISWRADAGRSSVGNALDDDNGGNSAGLASGSGSRPSSASNKPVMVMGWEDCGEDRFRCRWLYLWKELGNDRIAGWFGGYAGGGTFVYETFFAEFKGKRLSRFVFDMNDQVSGDECSLADLPDAQTIEQAAFECESLKSEWLDEDAYEDDELILRLERLPELRRAGDMAYLDPADPADAIGRKIAAMSRLCGMNASPKWPSVEVDESEADDEDDESDDEGSYHDDSEEAAEICLNIAAEAGTGKCLWFYAWKALEDDRIAGRVAGSDYKRGSAYRGGFIARFDGDEVVELFVRGGEGSELSWEDVDYSDAVAGGTLNCRNLPHDAKRAQDVCAWALVDWMDVGIWEDDQSSYENRIDDARHAEMEAVGKGLIYKQGDQTRFPTLKRLVHDALLARLTSSSSTAASKKTESRAEPAVYERDAGSRVEALVTAARKEIWSKEFYFAPSIPAKKLANALKSMAPGVREDEVILLIDSTVFGSASDGMLLTREALHVKNIAESARRAPIAAIKSVSIRAGGMLTTANLMLNGTPFFDFGGIDKDSMKNLAEMLQLHLADAMS